MGTGAVGVGGAVGGGAGVVTEGPGESEDMRCVPVNIVVMLVGREYMKSSDTHTLHYGTPHKYIHTPWCCLTKCGLYPISDGSVGI